MIEGTEHGQVAFLRQSLGQNIEAFRRRRHHNRNWAAGLAICGVSFSSLTTAMLALKEIPIFSGLPAQIMTMTAIILSASAAVANTWGSFFDHRWFWATYTTTLITLYGIRDDLEYEIASGNEISQNRIESLYSRLQSALRDASSSWSQKRMQEATSQQQAAASRTS